MNLQEIRRDIAYALVRFPCRIYTWLTSRYTFEKMPKIPGPYIVLANHNMTVDPMMIAIAFRERLAFVAGENTMRMGFFSKFLNRYFDLILRRKGDRDASTVYSILKHLKQGRSICLFPEGNRSWNGETGFIPPATAKMARRSKAYLVTYRFTGSYLSSPRWSSKNRKGRILGKCVNIYTPEKLASMTDAELLSSLEGDLYENAFERQNENAVSFSGKGLAENIETGYYICPECGSIDTIKSSGDDISCTSCGMHAKYSEYGLFEGFAFKNTLEWDKWQKSKLSDILAEKEDEPVFSDADVLLMTLGDDHEMTVEEKAALTAYKDRLEISGRAFYYSEMNGMTMHGNKNLTFGTADGYFELTADRVWCARKYLELFMQCTEGNYGV